VRARLGAWRRIGAPNHVMRWLREGVRCDWIAAPPPPFHHGVSRFTPDESAWLTGERDRCLLTGAWVRATQFDFVSRAFVVTHNGKRRLVLNFAFVNQFERKRACRYESLSTLRRSMQPGDWMWSCDLADAYHHVGIHTADQKYFTFALDTGAGVEYFSTGALSFGWTRSPWYFTEVMKPVVRFLRNQEVAEAPVMGAVSGPPTEGTRTRVLPWLDDFAFFRQGSQPDAVAARDSSFDLLIDLGITRNPTKGQAEPSHRLEDHLGFAIDSQLGQFQLTVRRELKLRTGALAILYHAARTARRVHSRTLAAFAGLAQSTYLALPLARCWLRSVFDDLATQQGWNGEVRLSRQSLADLRQFTQLRTSIHTSRPIWLRPDTAVGHVDAGPRGWGGQLNGAQRLLPAAGFWGAADAAQHITYRELVAVRLFVLWYLEALRGRRLLLFEDNQAVVAIITSLTSRSPELMAEVRRLIAVLDLHDISLRAVYIRSADNVVADLYSRIARPRDYAIRLELFELVQTWWGACTVDAFASGATALHERFWAEQPTEWAEAIDAFAQPWAGELVWAHPPPYLLQQLAQLLRAEPRAAALVCAPYWPGAAWYSDLTLLSEQRVTFPAGSLLRIAFDAPQHLESWPITIFHVPRRA
jgi:hypothetical protein